MPLKNCIKVRENGPLLCTGQVQVQTADGDELYRGEDVVLCRCGASANKPFCDGSHKTSGFEASGVVEGIDSAEPEPEDTLVITVRNNAMLIARGGFELLNADGSVAAVRQKAALCRCGQSENKPLCDGSHKGCGFSG